MTTSVPAKEAGRQGRLALSSHNAQDMKDPGLSAVLSLVIPGMGQIYNGEFVRALFWLVVTPGLWIGSGGVLGWVCHLVAAFTAHHRAKAINQRTPSRGK
ncbi:MAG: hypothetical protein ACE5JI_05325 [Acidobacteriota bacterium]